CVSTRGDALADPRAAVTDVSYHGVVPGSTASVLASIDTGPSAEVADLGAALRDGQRGPGDDGDFQTGAARVMDDTERCPDGRDPDGADEDDSAPAHFRSEAPRWGGGSGEVLRPLGVRIPELRSSVGAHVLPAACEIRGWCR